MAIKPKQPDCWISAEMPSDTECRSLDSLNPDLISYRGLAGSDEAPFNRLEKRNRITPLIIGVAQPLRGIHGSSTTSISGIPLRTPPYLVAVGLAVLIFSVYEVGVFVYRVGRRRLCLRKSLCPKRSYPRGSFVELYDFPCVELASRDMDISHG